MPWFDSVYGVVQVPPPPDNAHANDGQFIDLWNGVVAYSNLPPGFNHPAILQPVLSWGYNGIAAWWIVMWYIDSFDADLPFIFAASQVDSGTFLRLNTYVRNDSGCSVSDGNNCNWAMRVWENGGIDYTYYFNSTPGTWSIAWRAVLETYPPGGNQTDPECDCAELPQGGVSHWTSTNVYQPFWTPTDYHQQTANWAAESTNSPRLISGCNYNLANKSQSAVDLTW
jgi:hypothetical protein